MKGKREFGGLDKIDLGMFGALYLLLRIVRELFRICLYMVFIRADVERLPGNVPRCKLESSVLAESAEVAKVRFLDLLKGFSYACFGLRHLRLS